MELEYFFTCPWCGERISMILDLSVDRQSYVEDCEVCCNPIEVTFETADGAVVFFDARALE